MRSLCRKSRLAMLLRLLRRRPPRRLLRLRQLARYRMALLPSL
jgi:hypothetical protein